MAAARPSITGKARSAEERENVLSSRMADGRELTYRACLAVRETSKSCTGYDLFRAEIAVRCLGLRADQCQACHSAPGAQPRVAATADTPVQLGQAV
jgi:hypothetical protein